MHTLARVKAEMRTFAGFRSRCMTQAWRWPLVSSTKLRLWRYLRDGTKSRHTKGVPITG